MFGLVPCAADSGKLSPSARSGSLRRPFGHQAPGSHEAVKSADAKPPRFLLGLASLCLTACPGDDAGTTDTATSDSATSDGTTDPTDTEGSDETFCIHQCASDDDCLIGGANQDLTCVDSLCQGEPAESCTTDEACIATLSGWSFGAACTAGGSECEAAMQVCLDVGGESHCVSGPSMFLACVDIMLDEIEVTDIDGNAATVCGNANAACHGDGYCYAPCGSDDDCTLSSAPVCNVGTGNCECGSDADCETLGFSQFSTCNAGACGCSEDTDCVDGSAGDVCHPSGFCGCSADMACESVMNTFDGGMISCVQP